MVYITTMNVRISDLKTSNKSSHHTIGFKVNLLKHHLTCSWVATFINCLSPVGLLYTTLCIYTLLQVWVASITSL